MKKLLLLGTLIILSSLLTSCSQSLDVAAVGIENYLIALAEQDQDSMINHSCVAWEEDALLESQAYYGVETRLDGLDCTFNETDGEFSVISCEGNIIASYSGEDAPLPLDTRLYLSIEEGGEWRMCGYR